MLSPPFPDLADALETDVVREKSPIPTEPEVPNARLEPLGVVAQ
jgi:hypothetical protein